MTLAAFHEQFAEKISQAMKNLSVISRYYKTSWINKKAQSNTPRNSVYKI